MKDLVIYIPRNERIVRIFEGDGCNLSSEEVANGYVDYLYYDVFDPQNLQDVEDGGMVLLKKPVKEEFSSIQGVIDRVCEMIGYIYRPERTILSGLDDWWGVFTDPGPKHSCFSCKHYDKKLTEEPCINCNIRLRNDKWEGKDETD